MKTILALMLVFLVGVSAAPTRKVDCRDEYGHCPEWSKAGYCDRTGYKTYMTYMCAYSCNTCKDLKRRKESEGEDVASASGLDDGQLENPSDIQEISEKDEDGASANEPVSGEGEIHGDSDDYEEKKENDRVDKLQNEQSKDAALESPTKTKQSSERPERQSIAEKNEDNRDVISKKTQDENMATTEDRDLPGVHLLKFQEENVDDDVNPRSKISTRPKENPSANYKPLRETKAQSKEITSEKRDEDVSASGSMLDESGEAENDESKTANPKASGESEEMRDIAGDMKTGSQIFEADTFEAEDTSGCSSGFGCFSGNGEQIQSEKSEESGEREPRSKIAIPQIKNAKTQQAKLDEKIKTAKGQTSPVRDSGSHTNTAAKGDIQSNDEDEAPESDDIAGTKSIANSDPKMTTESPETSVENHLKAPKSDAEDEKISAEKANSSGSGADVIDDIQGQSVHGDNDESIDSGNALSGSDAEPIPPKSESLKEVQKAPTSDAAESEKVKEQDDTTAKSEPVDVDKNADMNGQNENIINSAAKSISDQKQSAAKTEADKDEEMNTEKDMKDNNEKSQSINESETQSDEGQEDKEQREDKTTKPESTNEDSSAAINDADSVDGQKDDAAETETDESHKSDTENEKMHGQDDRKTDTSKSKPNDNQSEESDLDKQKDVKAMETDSQSGGEKEDVEKTNETSSGSVAASIDTNHGIDADEDEEPGIDPTKSKSKTADTQPSDTEENDMEDALTEDMLNNKGSGAGSGQPEKDSSEDLSSPAARKRITSMEQLIKDDEPKVEKAKDAPAKTRENVPSMEETPNDYINTDLGKGQKVRLILDQHYYKPYSNEDSMAYEMLALDLKKEVERAVGNQAIVSQISFSEIQTPGKLPRYPRVLAKFMLHGDINVLQDAVRKGVVGDLMVDKKFFRSS